MRLRVRSILSDDEKVGRPAFFVSEGKFRLRVEGRTAETWQEPSAGKARRREVEVLTAKEQSLLASLEPRAEQEGVEIVTVEVVGAKKAPTIRVYIDTPEGVSFDQLASAQRWINDIMDELDPFPGAYMLEVSSPGIDRPLRTLEHFSRFEGEVAVVTTKAPIDGRSKWTGKLAGVEGEDVLMDVDGLTERIALSEIKRARLKGSVDFSS